MCDYYVLLWGKIIFLSCVVYLFILGEIVSEIYSSKVGGVMVLDAPQMLKLR